MKTKRILFVFIGVYLLAFQLANVQGAQLTQSNEQNISQAKSLTEADILEAVDALTKQDQLAAAQLAKESPYGFGGIIAPAVGFAHVPDVIARGVLKLIGVLPKARKMTEFLLWHDPIYQAYERLKLLPAAIVGKLVSAILLMYVFFIGFKKSKMFKMMNANLKRLFEKFGSYRGVKRVCLVLSFFWVYIILNFIVSCIFPDSSPTILFSLNATIMPIVIIWAFYWMYLGFKKIEATQ